MAYNNKMFRFIKKVSIAAMTCFSFGRSNANSLECLSMNNQECKARPEIIDFNSNKSVFYP